MADETEIRSPRTTVTIDQHVSDVVVDQLDETNYFGLSRARCTRAELLLYAMAVGYDSGFAVPINKPLSGGFARTESFSDKFTMLIRAMHFKEIGFDKPDGLRDINAGYNLAEKYANGGFQFIEGELNDHIGSEEKANMVIAELNKKYEELFG